MLRNTTHLLGAAALALATLALPSHGAILLNFGATVNDNTNSAMHEDGGVTGVNWNLLTTADVATGIVTSTGAATAVGIDLGTGSSGTLNWGSQPSSAAALGSVFKTGIYEHNGHSATYTGSGEVGVRITGLAAGVYDVYFSGRNTNSSNGESHRYYYETVAAGSGNTTYSTDNSLLVAYESSANFLANTPTTWDRGIDYDVVRYTITANQDIVLIASSRGFIATMGVVEIVPEPASMVMLALGGVAMIRQRRA